MFSLSGPSNPPRTHTVNALRAGTQSCWWMCPQSLQGTSWTFRGREITFSGTSLDALHELPSGALMRIAGWACALISMALLKGSRSLFWGRGLFSLLD